MRRYLFGIMMVMLVGTFSAQGQQIAKLQSIFIYNFIKQIEWPAAVSKGDFVIGVLGATPLQNELENLAKSKKVDNRKISVLHFADVSEISNCHIVFVPAMEADKISRVKTAIKQRPTLIVSEKEGATKDGAMINFVVRDYKQKFELNEDLASRQNLKVSAYLKKLAIVVN
jgi:hypothetical protein